MSRIPRSPVLADAGDPGAVRTEVKVVHLLLVGGELVHLGQLGERVQPAQPSTFCTSLYRIEQKGIEQTRI
jgi:hypothetical protein